MLFRLFSALRVYLASASGVPRPHLMSSKLCLPVCLSSEVPKVSLVQISQN